MGSVLYKRGMNPVYDFSAGDHAIMLADLVRLGAYRRAIINQVKPGMAVAEIGTGTGILSAYAAAQTQGPVVAMEYFDTTAKMAEDMIRAAGLKQVKVLRGESYDLTLDPQPEVLITETIGAIGPEENIVELCYDFKKRHPKLKTIIPSRLRVCAEPIRCKKVLDFEKKFFDYFSAASFGTFDFDAIRPALAKIWTSDIPYTNLSEAEGLGHRIVLTDYALGETKISAFSQEIDLSGIDGVDAVHLYFEAQLDDEVLLSTHRAQPETHWLHAYVRKPANSNRLTVSYSSPSESVDARWSTN